ncbi:MAG TPA: UDP-N-acetylmuramate dehydrogenase [Patescibacteria group bacterium]
MLVHKDFDLAPFLWYKIGGKVKYLLECKNKADILEALRFIKENNLAKIFVLGLGSNLIFAEEHFDGAVIRITKDEKNSSIRLTTEGYVEAFAGELLDDVITFSLRNNLVGLEWAGGLPGTVGAAVRGNVGAFGSEIKDTFISAEILDYSSGKLEIKTFTDGELRFAYRESLVKTHKKMLVISAKFELQKVSDESRDKGLAIYAKNIQFRKDHHPLEYPNCGSVFKNIRDKQQVYKVLSVYPELKDAVEQKWHGKVAVASLIEKLGLKGYRIGDAQISEKHALFIVNRGHARAREVLQLIDLIQEKFQEKFGFRLEVEVEIVK